MSRTQDFHGRRSPRAVLCRLGLVGLAALVAGVVATPSAREAFTQTAVALLALLGIALALFAAVLLLAAALWRVLRHTGGRR